MYFYSKLALEVVLDTTKVQIFKQITTIYFLCFHLICCFRYHKGTDFQANHNRNQQWEKPDVVVLDTTKVQIFKQITTNFYYSHESLQLF